MKASGFNTIADIGENMKLLFNSYKNTLVKVDQNLFTVYQKIISQEEQNGLDRSDPYIYEAIEDYKKGGFIVEDDFDEIAYLKSVDKKRRFSDYKNFALTISPTMECNFSCAYCYENDKKKHGRMSGEMEDKIIKYVEGRMQEYGSFMVTWFGGEPLLALDTICRLSEAFIKMAEKKKVKYRSAILTNGYLLDRKTVSILKKYGVHGAQITLDGPAEYHDRVRCLKNGEGTFKKILDNIKDVGNDFLISISTNIGKENAELYPALLDELEAKGVLYNMVLSIMPLQPREYLNRQINEAVYTSEEFSKVYVRLVKMLVDRKAGTEVVSKSYETHCGANSNMCLMANYDGSLYKCWDTMGNPSECVGHIGRKMELCEGAYRWLARDVFENKKCTSCSVLPLCMGGCTRKVMVKDRILNQQDQCSHYKYNLPELLKILYRQKLDVMNREVGT